MSAPVPPSTLTTFTASDGDNLAVQDWPVAEGAELRGVVVLVHGLGEHAGRYEHVARRLNQWGFAVRGYDQYGHGESGGVRGGLPSPMRLVDDLGDMVDSVRARTPEGIPVLVLGHSLGGLVAACYAVAHPARIDGLILSSPALATRLNGFQKLLLGVLPHIAPRLRVGNGLEPRWLSHDPAVEAAYRSDPLVHDRISAGLALFIAESGPRVVAHAPLWPVETLLLYAGADRLVDPVGSRAFSSTAPPRRVTCHCFDELYHEIFNEADSRPVFDALQRWLAERF
ncbi:MAG TPA: alpha/beta hydrolase [Ramlibacter sp.]|jgi:alpha-beta hydrolase superfamily lysophospholipase|uniref:alpha/beta hydrolase n=1 Tax=Ramlibacter sp. TaxID=1917967 RepID=UPI002D42BE80|nr:lysophospholipase [Ramlibacter sp.]HZY17180.1 alpha/beta hydrolase [Ramlibacter sp.]